MEKSLSQWVSYCVINRGWKITLQSLLRTHTHTRSVRLMLFEVVAIWAVIAPHQTLFSGLDCAYTVLCFEYQLWRWSCWKFWISSWCVCTWSKHQLHPVSSSSLGGTTVTDFIAMKKAAFAASSLIHSYCNRISSTFQISTYVTKLAWIYQPKKALKWKSSTGSTQTFCPIWRWQ